jgi:aryl-alcohol dehydrogenase-like predicted oxidoreductase
MNRPLSPLGLGAWAFGRTGWGVQHDNDSRAAILRAVELGVTWIDTAAVYGDGHSERLIGTTLGELSDDDRPLVFTKGGVRVDPASGATVRDLRPASLREECEASLRRLDVERLDLYQLHWPVDEPGVVEQAWETLGELQTEGKIRWAGVSNFDVPLLERCAFSRPIDALQIPLSLISRDAGRELLPWVVQHEARALAYSPLESGLLSGHFSIERLDSLPQGDWRGRREQFQRPQIDRALAAVQRLESIAAELSVTLAELAIAWTLAFPGVGGVIVGARNAEQVEGWAGASSVDLGDSVLERIDDALSESGAGSGPFLHSAIRGPTPGGR